MIEFWYASYIFLGLSLAIGAAVYLTYRALLSRYKKRREQSLLRQLEEQYLKPQDTEEVESDQD